MKTYVFNGLRRARGKIQLQAFGYLSLSFDEKKVAENPVVRNAVLLFLKRKNVFKITVAHFLLLVQKKMGKKKTTAKSKMYSQREITITDLMRFLFGISIENRMSIASL